MQKFPFPAANWWMFYMKYTCCFVSLANNCISIFILIIDVSVGWTNLLYNQQSTDTCADKREIMCFFCIKQDNLICNQSPYLSLTSLIANFCSFLIKHFTAFFCFVADILTLLWIKNIHRHLGLWIQRSTKKKKDKHKISTIKL